MGYRNLELVLRLFKKMASLVHVWNTGGTFATMSDLEMLLGTRLISPGEQTGKVQTRTIKKVAQFTTEQLLSSTTMTVNNICGPFAYLNVRNYPQSICETVDNFDKF